MSDIEQQLKRPLIARGVEGGIEWAVLRAPIYNAANAYIKVPDGHPRHEEEYHDFGGIPWGECTWGGKGGWQGFDTLHAGQYWPGQGQMFDGDTYMTVNVVIEWAKQAARNCRAVIDNGTHVI